ncbi:MAG TPA: type I phosphomannose isomerase catalytic subunit [Acidobacteriaceae bacterium]|nr:type I phosphomannose isomerase catalytic subunit [Acidobacteriaceae bacterium]
METLCPFRLEPFFRTRPWGFNDLNPWYNYKTEGEPIGEVWLTGEMCKAGTGPLKGMSLEDITRQHGTGLLGPGGEGRSFPLLIKLLFPKEKLSVQVHPDDALAQKYGEPRGKTECWYALDAKPGAQVALGFRPGVTREEIGKAIENHSLEKLLAMVPVNRGDMIFVDAGTVHAMEPGAVVLETQQTSDLTYRLYDYGRPRELHLEKSFAAMQLQTRARKVAPQSENGHSILIDEQYFRMERWPVRAGSAAKLTAAMGRVQMLFVVSGKLGIDGSSFDAFTVERNQLAVIPAGAAPWTLDASSEAEVIRILPAES